MRARDLARAGARHHWRTNAGVALGTAVATAVLVGALLVGDSVRSSLRRRALERIGGVELALIGRDRFFGADLAERLEEVDGSWRLAPCLWLPGLAVAGGGARRANDVQVFGVDGRFPRLAPDGQGFPVPGPGEAAVGERLARQLDLEPGDELLVRVERPSALPRDAALATSDDVSFALRLRVARVVGAEAFGAFSLAGGALPPFDLFCELRWLQGQLEQGGKANLLLAGVGGSGARAAPGPSRAPTRPAGGTGGEGKRLPSGADLALSVAFRPSDAGLSVRTDPDRGLCEVRTERVFLEDPIVDRLAGADLPLTGVLTWFCNSLEVGQRATPYSTVAGIGVLAGEPGAEVRQLVGELDDEGVVLNRWIADDLQAKVGDTLTLRYYVVGPGNDLVEETHALTVRRVVPLEGAAADPGLMPDYPGLADSENCRDWEPGVPVDLDRIRDEDEAYWDDHRGTPKAFVTLATARKLWGSRFGSLTAIRSPSERKDDLEKLLATRLRPADLGLFFRDVRSPALLAASPTSDFGGLFLGLSFFLLISAFLLTTLLFVFGVEQRAVEIGTLQALGFTPRKVARLLVREALPLALVGTAGGTLLGVLYTAGVLRGLRTLWSAAVAGTPVALDVSPLTLTTGAGLSIATALLSLRLTLRRLVRRPPVELLAGDLSAPPAHVRARRRRLQGSGALVCVAGGLALILLTDAGTGAAAAGAFFGAGALCLVAALLAIALLLGRPGAGGRAAAPGAASVAGLGLQGARRRPGRSLATAGLLASGVFLVVAIGVNRIGPPPDASLPSSGTGGFELYGTSTLPVLDDLGTRAGRDAFALDDADLEGVRLVSLRVLEGDDASCLNLATPSEPRLLGAPAERLAARGAFSFARVLELEERPTPANPWELLEADLGPDVVPAIGDQASVQWTMKKGLGESISYLDERGRPFDVRIVATLSGSILQGDLVIAESRFRERYPSESGWRAFLLDTPPGKREEVSATLTRALEDVGLELEPAAERLAAFQAVQNTYITIFQLLGALGVLLGTAGLGLVVLRNALERRAELATLRAVGFSKRDVHWLVASEHAWLCLLGMAAGVLPALVATLPATGTSSEGTSASTLALLVLAVGAAGMLWVLGATALALRGDLLSALRNE